MLGLSSDSSTEDEAGDQYPVVILFSRASSFFFCTKAIIDICLGFADEDVVSLGVPDPDAGDEPFLDLALLTGLVLVSCLLLLVSAVCCLLLVGSAVCLLLENKGQELDWSLLLEFLFLIGGTEVAETTIGV